MTTNKSQEERVIGKILTDGFITRNECLKNYISRLSAIIKDLEKEGWVFEAGYTPQRKDYKYKMVTCPYKFEYYTHPITKETIRKIIK